MVRPLARAADAVLDPSIVFSFDQTGFLRHRAQFDDGDLEVDMAGRLCLVTGGNSGLGLATARGLAQRGATVWVLGRNEERSMSVCATLRSGSGSNFDRFWGGTAQVAVHGSKAVELNTIHKEHKELKFKLYSDEDDGDDGDDRIADIEATNIVRSSLTHSPVQTDDRQFGPDEYRALTRRHTQRDKYINDMLVMTKALMRRK